MAGDPVSRVARKRRIAEGKKRWKGCAGEKRVLGKHLPRERLIKRGERGTGAVKELSA